MDWRSVLLAGLGSMLGGSLRYVFVFLIDRRLVGNFPWGVLAVNVVGSFVIGFLVPLFERMEWGKDHHIPLLLSFGLLGGFTTFSTFSLQTLKLLEQGHWGLAASYALGSFSLCLVGVFCGVRLGQMICS